jgi:hypothetical protein
MRYAYLSYVRSTRTSPENLLLVNLIIPKSAKKEHTVTLNCFVITMNLTCNNNKINTIQVDTMDVNDISVSFRHISVLQDSHLGIHIYGSFPSKLMKFYISLYNTDYC